MMFNVMLDIGAQLPIKSHDTDAGFDLFSTESASIPAGRRKKFSTGVHLELKVGWEAQIRSRSGMSCKYGVTVINSPGTIDAGYRGVIHVTLQNTDTEHYIVHKGDRIAQLVIKEIPNVQLVPVAQLNSTIRGENGHGSTGK